MRLAQLRLGLCGVAMLGLAACAGTPPPETAQQSAATAVVTTPATVTATQTTETATPVITATPAHAPTTTQTGVPVATATPATPTPTPNPVVSLNPDTSQQINVRSGPGTDYPVIASFKAGAIAVVVGRNADQSWWEVKPEGATSPGWVNARLVKLAGNADAVPVEKVAPPPPPTSTPTPATTATQTPAQAEADTGNDNKPLSSDELEKKLRCGKDFCITYQAMVPIWENGGCIGNHSIFVTVLQGPPPGKPLDGIVLGDTFNNVEVASGSKGPGQAEFTLWMNTMSVKVKRHIDGHEFTSEESFPFTAHDELIPAEVLAANGYCDSSVEKCRVAQNHNQVCRGHYSWKVTFHKFD